MEEPRETWSMLQSGVEALFPPRGSSIIGIKKGEAPLLMSRSVPFRLLSPRKWKMEIVPRARGEGMQMIGIVYRMGIIIGFIVGFAYNPV